MSEAHGGWRAFLAARGARPEGSGGDVAAVREEIQAARDSDVVADLSFWTLVRVHGADAQAFLQGQLSNDIREVTPERSQLSAWCTPKGRMLAIFRVFRRGEEYFLQLPAPLQPEIVRRLRMYVLRARVVVESAGEEFVRIGLSGPNARRILSGTDRAVPEAPNGVTHDGPLTILFLPGPHPRFQLIVPAAEAPGLWDRLATVARPVGTDAWAWLNIRAGLPEILPGTVEEFVPQMANLDLLQGVSFTKGCYPGQEIVARVKYLGRIKQRMFPAWTGGGECPSPGTAIVAAPGDGPAIGWVVDGRAAPAGGWDMLVVLGLEQRRNELRFGGSNDSKIELQEPPYRIDDEL